MKLLSISRVGLAKDGAVFCVKIKLIFIFLYKAFLKVEDESGIHLL